MSAIRKLRRVARQNQGAITAGLVPQTEMRQEAMALVERLLPVLFETKPVSPLVCLLALEVARRHVNLMVDESSLPEEDRARFWAGVESEMAAYEAALQSRRS